MKKIVFSLLLVAAPVTLFAQLKVNSDGNTQLGASTYRHANFTNAKVKTESYLTGNGGSDYVAIQGYANMSSPLSNNKAVGVLGIAGNGDSGHNMGVLGYLAGSKNGAGIFGATNDNLNYPVPGIYAGFFHGQVYSTGTISAPAFNTTSDIRLKKNITSVKESEGDYRFLDRVLDMNVIEYNLIDRYAGKDAKKSRIPSLEDQRHIGLAAQELQKLIPEVVVEGQDGYLGVNYIELVPVLIRSIQELKEELDELKGSGTVRRSAASTTDISNTTVKTQNVLYQNTPNPFKEQTVIRFRLAENVQNAAVCIFDMSGKLVKKLPISSGDEQVTIGGYELGEGLYLYSLVVNGQEVDTKKMIISK